MNPSDTNKALAAPSAAESQLLQSSLLRLTQGQDDNANSGPPALSATPTLAGLLHTLRRRWTYALGLAAALTVVTVAAVFILMPPQYVAAIRIRLLAKQASLEDIEFPLFKANMEAHGKSPIVLSAALNEKTSAGRDIKDLSLVKNQGIGAVEWLETALKTEFNPLLGPEVLRISLPSDQPEEAAELLNAIGRAFLNEYAQMERSKKEQRLRELRNKKDAYEEELRGLRNVLDTQGKNFDVRDRDAASVHIQQLLAKLNAAETARRAFDDEVARAEAEIITGKARIINIDKQQVPEDVLFDVFSKDAVILGQLKRIEEIETEIGEANRKFNDPYLTQVVVPLRHEKIKILNQRKSREAQLQPEIERRYRVRVREQLEHEISLADEKRRNFARWRDERAKEITVLERQVREAGSGNQNMPPQVLQTMEKIDLAKLSLTSTAQKINDLELEVPQARVTLIQPAIPPTSRDTRTQTKVAGAGGLGMFILGLFGVAFVEFRARKISLPHDVTHGLGLNVIGTVPAMPARSRKPSAAASATEQQWLSQLQESVDAIRTVILHQARHEALHVIMVTSASSGEGKTTLTTQLAASLARAWKRTLVIDGDLRHPATHKLFDVPQEPGLAEVLRGEVEPTDAIRATPFSRLWVLPAGNGDNHAIQALAQDNVRTLFEQLKQQYDFIIIDSPPVLPVTDALLLGQHVDGVVFSILRDVSRAPAIYAAQQKLAPLGVAMLGAVVLGTEPEFGDKNYRYAMAAK